MARRRKHHREVLAGAEELDAALRNLSDRAGGFLVKEAAEAGAEVIRAEASRLAPRDTGLLAEELKDEPHRLQVGRSQIDIGPSKKAWYGRLLELGTRYIAPTPFLRPALDTKKDEATQAVRDVLRRIL